MQQQGQWVVSSVNSLLTVGCHRRHRYRHESIPTAIAALKQLGQANNIAFDATEEKALFSDSNLSNYDALLFLSNSEEGTLSQLEYVQTETPIQCWTTPGNRPSKAT